MNKSEQKWIILFWNQKIVFQQSYYSRQLQHQKTLDNVTAKSNFIEKHCSQISDIEVNEARKNLNSVFSIAQSM